MISMNQIPANQRAPLFFAEFDNSNASVGLAVEPYSTLLIGNRRPSGTIPALSLQRITDATQAAQYFGADSVLADMAESFLDLNTNNPLYCIALDDLAGGAVATGTITITGTPTQAGTASFMIAGWNFQIGVATTDTPTSIAAALVAAINGSTECLVSAANAAGVVTITSKHKGDFNNDIDLSYNYFDGEILPPGITVAIVGMAGGAGNPDVTAIWPVIGDEQFILMGSPYTDSANLTAMETELSSRFGAMRAIEGFAIYSKRGTFGVLSTMGAARNSQFSTIMGMAGPSNPWQWTGQLLAQVAASASIDPARPFQSLELPNVYAPHISQRRTLSERNQLLYSGISTYQVDSGGNVMIDSLITTFQKNAYGSPDTSYLYLNTSLVLSFLRFDLKARMTSRYPRHKLADDGNTFAPGQAIVTPNIIKAEIVTKFSEWEENGLVENADQFKAGLIVERNTSNRSRVDVLMPPELVGALRILGVKIQFLL